MWGDTSVCAQQMRCLTLTLLLLSHWWNLWLPAQCKEDLVLTWLEKNKTNPTQHNLPCCCCAGKRPLWVTGLELGRGKCPWACGQYCRSSSRLGFFFSLLAQRSCVCVGARYLPWAATQQEQQLFIVKCWYGAELNTGFGQRKRVLKRDKHWSKISL